MFWFILLALTNGVLISSSRLINSRLAQSKTNLAASYWNHLGGFVFLTLLSPFVSDTPQLDHNNAPFYYYVGGAIGVLVVLLNSWCIKELGAAHSTMLVITGQLICSTILEYTSKPTPSLTSTLAGIVMLLIGILLLKLPNTQIKSANTAEYKQNL